MFKFYRIKERICNESLEDMNARVNATTVQLYRHIVKHWLQLEPDSTITSIGAAVELDRLAVKYESLFASFKSIVNTTKDKGETMSKKVNKKATAQTEVVTKAPVLEETPIAPTEPVLEPTPAFEEAPAFKEELAPESSVSEAARMKALLEQDLNEEPDFTGNSNNLEHIPKINMNNLPGAATPAGREEPINLKGDLLDTNTGVTLPPKIGKNEVYDNLVIQKLQEKQAACEAFASSHIVSKLLVRKPALADRILLEDGVKIKDLEVSISVEQLIKSKEKIIESCKVIFGEDGQTVMAIGNGPNDKPTVQRVLDIINDHITNSPDAPLIYKASIPDATNPIIGAALRDEKGAETVFNKDSLKKTLLNQTNGSLKTKDKKVQITVKAVTGTTQQKKLKALQDSKKNGETLLASEIQKTFAAVSILADDKEDKVPYVFYIRESDVDKLVAKPQAKSTLAVQYYSKPKDNGEPTTLTYKVPGVLQAKVINIKETAADYLGEFPASTGLYAPITSEQAAVQRMAAVSILARISAEYAAKVDNTEGIVSSVLSSKTEQDLATAAQASAEAEDDLEI